MVSLSDLCFSKSSVNILFKITRPTSRLPSGLCANVLSQSNHTMFQVFAFLQLLRWNWKCLEVKDVFPLVKCGGLVRFSIKLFV